MRIGRQLDPRVAAVMAQAPAERLLAWGTLIDEQVVTCTDLALHVPGEGRFAWDAVVRGAWSEEFLDVVVQDAPGAKARQLRLRFDEPGQVPAVFRERVQWTVVASQQVELRHDDGRTGTAMLNARRSPQSGEVRWAVVFGAGINPADPGWRAAADRALSELRDQLGT